MRMGVAPLGREWVAWADAAVSRQSVASPPNRVTIRVSRSLGIESPLLVVTTLHHTIPTFGSEIRPLTVPSDTKLI